MFIDVVSLFPDMFGTALTFGMTGRSIEKGVIQLFTTNPRDFTTDRHKTVDDSPYGGGSGMVMKIEPLVQSLEHITHQRGKGHRILLTPSGTPLSQEKVEALAKTPHLVLLCGRYEGVDERISHFIDEEISIGDFILSGGEFAAFVLIDAIARLKDGVLHNQTSLQEESFQQGLLEYPQYTRPSTFHELKVPSILLSGDHERINKWRRKQSLARTKIRRPDLLARANLSQEDHEYLSQWADEKSDDFS